MINRSEFNFLIIEPFTSLKSLGVAIKNAATVYIALVQVQYSYTMFPKEVFGVRIDLQVIFVVKKVSNYESFRHFLVTQVTIVNKFFTYSLLLYAKKLYVLCSYKLIKNT